LSSDPPPQQPPFHWRYYCYPFGTSTLTDSGTVLVELKQRRAGMVPASGGFRDEGGA
jgi:hypothetical protein